MSQHKLTPGTTFLSQKSRKLFLLLAVLVMTIALAGSPQNITLACEPGTGSCTCPGC